ncbi:hypothetical protein MKEN_00271500 [Mycena kentingensis (nom. inval.)]|nr:hypothetical protein MKEN_00271500 [Mycena kentingensis (nom. inval.)]
MVAFRGLKGPNARALTDEERGSLAAAKVKRQKQLVSWFQRELVKQNGGPASKATKNPPKNNPIVEDFVKTATGSGKTRVHHSVEVYQKLYRADIHAEVARRGWSSMNEAARIDALGPDADEETVAEQKRQVKLAQAARMKMYRGVASEMWKDASAEAQDQVAEAIRREREQQDAKKQAVEGERTHAQRTEGIAAIDSILDIAHKTIERATDWVGISITGGLDGTGGFSVKVKCFGTTDAGYTFRQLHPDFEGGVANPFVEFLTRAFPESARIASIVAPEGAADAAGDPPPAGDEGSASSRSLPKPRRIRPSRKTRKDLPELPQPRTDPAPPAPVAPLAPLSFSPSPQRPAPHTPEALTSPCTDPPPPSENAPHKVPQVYADDDDVGRALGVPTNGDLSGLIELWGNGDELWGSGDVPDFGHLSPRASNDAPFGAPFGVNLLLAPELPPSPDTVYAPPTVPYSLSPPDTPAYRAMSSPTPAPYSLSPPARGAWTQPRKVATREGPPPQQPPAVRVPALFAQQRLPLLNLGPATSHATGNELPSAPSPSAPLPPAPAPPMQPVASALADSTNGALHTEDDASSVATGISVPPAPLGEVVDDGVLKKRKRKARVMADATEFVLPTKGTRTRAAAAAAAGPSANTRKQASENHGFAAKRRKTSHR